MSDTPGGPGWWEASDHKWYPPETHPDPEHRRQYAAASAPGLSAGGYPAGLTVAPATPIARWRALLHLFMAIPHLAIAYLLQYLQYAVGFVSWLVILFTGRMPEGLHNLQAMIIRYMTRTYGYILLLTEQYPPFEFSTTGADQSGYAIRSDFRHDPGERNRLTVFFRIILAIPHAIVVAALAMVALVLFIIGWFAVLFTGRMPDGIRDFIIGVGRWAVRFDAYLWLLTDEYPPFSTS
jgi:hypothetical protein